MDQKTNFKIDGIKQFRDDRTFYCPLKIWYLKRHIISLPGSCEVLNCT